MPSCHRCRKRISKSMAEECRDHCRDCYDLIKYANTIPKAPPRDFPANTEMIRKTEKDYQGE